MGVLGNFDHERFCQAAHKRIWAGERHVAAYHAAYRETIYRGSDPDEKAIAANVRKLRNRKDVKGRLGELAEYAGKLSGIDAAWAQVQLKELDAEIKAFNLDDYFGPVDDRGNRHFDFTKITREQMGRLHEVTVEEEVDAAGIRVRKIKFSGPKKAPERVAVISTMARIGGWEAPKKVAPTNADGDGPAEITVTWKDPDAGEAT